MRRDLLQGAGRGQCSFLQSGVHLFNVFEPPLKFADPQPEGADFLGDGLEVFQAEEMIRRGLAVVKSATALGPPTRQRTAQKRIGQKLGAGLPATPEPQPDSQPVPLILSVARAEHLSTKERTPIGVGELIVFCPECAEREFG